MLRFFVLVGFVVGLSGFVGHETRSNDAVHAQLEESFSDRALRTRLGEHHQERMTVRYSAPSKSSLNPAGL